MLLLTEIGFENVEVTGRTGDGGLDVQAELTVGGITRVKTAIQVKRWKHNVPGKVIRELRGALTTDQRGLVWTHSTLMLAADAGFAATGILASNAGRSVSDRNRHKQAAIVSMGVASLGTVLMWFARR